MRTEPLKFRGFFYTSPQNIVELDLVELKYRFIFVL